MTDKLWSVRDIADYCSCSVDQARRIVAQPEFPPKVRLWEGAHPRWIEREVREFCEARREAA